MEYGSEQPKLDVQAEIKQFSPNIQTDDEQIKIALSGTNTQQLPPSILYEPTQVNISVDPDVQVSKVASDIRIKFDPELEIKNLSKVVDGLDQQLSQTVNSIQSRWISDPKPSSDFEERPTLEQTNLIFDQRKEEFKKYPIWA